MDVICVSFLILGFHVFLKSLKPYLSKIIIKRVKRNNVMRDTLLTI